MEKDKKQLDKEKIIRIIFWICQTLSILGATYLVLSIADYRHGWDAALQYYNSTHTIADNCRIAGTNFTVQHGIIINGSVKP